MKKRAVQPESTVAILVDVLRRWYFFRRFQDAFSSLNIKPVIISHLPSIIVLAKRAGFDTVLVRKERNFGHLPDLSKTLEALNGQLTEAEVSTLYSSYSLAIGRLQVRHNIDMFFVWNGGKASDQAARDFALERKIPIAYFEITNLSGKLFVDPVGVNAQSLIYKNPGVLDHLPERRQEFERWRREYLENKLIQHIVPQRYASKKRNLIQIIDLISICLGLTPTHERLHPVRSLRLARRKGELELALSEPPGRDMYFFFPMQVSSDTQILINSDTDNFEALDHALEIAQQLGLELCVKLHPAEHDRGIIKRVMRLANRRKFRLVAGNTFQMISASAGVITINSTVGLEARLLGKPVTCLGRSMYKHLDDGRLAKLIMSYFLEIDYFNDHAVSIEALRAIMNRANLPWEMERNK